MSATLVERVLFTPELLELRRSMRDVLLVVAAYAHHTGLGCTASIPTIARFAGCGETTCKAALRELRRLGYLSWEEAKGGRGKPVVRAVTVGKLGDMPRRTTGSTIAQEGAVVPPPSVPGKGADRSSKGVSQALKRGQLDRPQEVALENALENPHTARAHAHEEKSENLRPASEKRVCDSAKSKHEIKTSQNVLEHDPDELWQRFRQARGWRQATSWKTAHAAWRQLQANGTDLELVTRIVEATSTQQPDVPVWYLENRCWETANWYGRIRSAIDQERRQAAGDLAIPLHPEDQPLDGAIPAIDVHDAQTAPIDENDPAYWQQRAAAKRAESCPLPSDIVAAIFGKPEAQHIVLMPRTGHARVKQPVRQMLTPLQAARRALEALQRFGGTAEQIAQAAARVANLEAAQPGAP